MAAQLLNTDVPPKLVALARQIDVDAYSPQERAVKLQALEKLASQHINFRTTTIAQTQVYDIHVDLVNVLNKYDFTKLSAWKKALAEPLITKWVRANLILKK